MNFTIHIPYEVFSRLAALRDDLDMNPYEYVSVLVAKHVQDREALA